MAMWRNRTRARTLWLLLAAALALCVAGNAQTAPAAPTAPTPAAKNTCLDCHSVLDPPLRVNEHDYALDIHAQKGLTCADCHGGDPTSDDNAMDPKKGFRRLKRADVPGLCARCHSDAAYMRRFNPSLRTDQFSQYQTSVHGKRRAAGDDKVAVCTDCHGLHGIHAPKDPASSVHPLNIAQTCARCHADAALMKPYGIATNQYAEYKTSVHHAALTVRGDLSAPTCTTCHGNHGAAPPGVASVANVCSTCHLFQAQLFAASPHQKAFAEAKLPGCVTCHTNHGIKSPSDAMLGAGQQSVCTNCHVEGDKGFVAAVAVQRSIGGLADSIEQSHAVLRRAAESGMEVSQAELQETQARDALTKARVSVHAFRVAAVESDVAAGMRVAAATHQAGLQALAEREYRRKGLAVSVLAIFAVLIGLWLYTRELERPGRS